MTPKPTERVTVLVEAKIPAKVVDLINKTRFKWFLKLHPTRHSTELLKVLIDSYDVKERVFVFHNNIKLCFTLEDVLHITGLPVNGDPVTGATFKDTPEVSKRLFGYDPKEDCGTLKLNKMRNEFEVLPADADEETLCKFARAWIFQILGCTILTPKKSNELSTKFAPLLHDLDRVDNYAWGAAYLTNLHVALERAKTATTDNVALESSTLPLMVFILERIPKVAQTLTEGANFPKEFPLMVGWSKALKKPLSNSHRKPGDIGRILQEQLLDTDVIWQPYANLPTTFLPTYVDKRECILGKARVNLICFEHARYQRPDLCLRQFGQHEINILPALIKSKTIKSCGQRGIDYRIHKCLRRQVEEWNSRFERLVVGDVGGGDEGGGGSQRPTGGEGCQPVDRERFFVGGGDEGGRSQGQGPVDDVLGSVERFSASPLALHNRGDTEWPTPTGASQPTLLTPTSTQQVHVEPVIRVADSSRRGGQQVPPTEVVEHDFRAMSRTPKAPKHFESNSLVLKMHKPRFLKKQKKNNDAA